MSGPAVPLSEHAARATASFARLLAEAEEGNATSGKANSSGGHIDAAISPSLDDTLHKCDTQRKVYSPPYLLKFKEQFTEAPKGLPPGLACLPANLSQPERPSKAAGRPSGERPGFRRGESARDVTTLRLHRGRRGPGMDSTPARAGSPFSPRPKTPGSPTIPRWHRPESQEGPRGTALGSLRGRTSAPSTPQQWKRAEEPAKAVEEEDDEAFDPSSMEDDASAASRGSWRRAEERPAEAVPAADGAKVWTPRRRQGAMSKEQELLSQVKGILNKLSAENFHQLCGQLFELEVPTLDVLKGIVDIIFDKATLEPTFCSLYAQLCADWANRAPKFQEPGSDRDMTFRRVLLNRCQVMFEAKKKQKPEEGGSNPAGEVQAAAPVKRVLIGNVIFIGELYRKKLITPKIIHICLGTLLASVTDAVAARKKSGTKTDQHVPLDVECLCKLFIIVGRDLDLSLGSDSRKRMEEYFRAMRGIMTDKSLPARIRFLVQDVVEFRQAGWVHKTTRSGK